MIILCPPFLPQNDLLPIHGGHTNDEHQRDGRGGMTSKHLPSSKHHRQHNSHHDTHSTHHSPHQHEHTHHHHRNTFTRQPSSYSSSSGSEQNTSIGSSNQTSTTTSSSNKSLSSSSGSSSYSPSSASTVTQNNTGFAMNSSAANSNHHQRQQQQQAKRSTTLNVESCPSGEYDVQLGIASEDGEDDEEEEEEQECEPSRQASNFDLKRRPLLQLTDSRSGSTGSGSNRVSPILPPPNINTSAAQSMLTSYRPVAHGTSSARQQSTDIDDDRPLTCDSPLTPDFVPTPPPPPSSSKRHRLLLSLVSQNQLGTAAAYSGDKSLNCDQMVCYHCAQPVAIQAGSLDHYPHDDSPASSSFKYYPSSAGKPSHYHHQSSRPSQPPSQSKLHRNKSCSSASPSGQRTSTLANVPTTKSKRPQTNRFTFNFRAPSTTVLPTAPSSPAHLPTAVMASANSPSSFSGSTSTLNTVNSVSAHAQPATPCSASPLDPSNAAVQHPSTATAMNGGLKSKKVKPLVHPLDRSIAGIFTLTIFFTILALLTGAPIVMLLFVLLPVGMFFKRLCECSLFSRSANLEPLSSIDAFWLHSSHVTHCLLYVDKGLSIQQLRDVISSRVLSKPELARFKARLVFRGLCQSPYWSYQDADQFDHSLEEHIIQDDPIASKRLLRKRLAQFMTEPLPMDRPLWQIRYAVAPYTNRRHQVMLIVRVHQSLSQSGLIHLLTQYLSDSLPSPSNVHLHPNSASAPAPPPPPLQYQGKPRFGGATLSINIFRAIIVGPLTFFLWMVWAFTRRHHNHLTKSNKEGSLSIHWIALDMPRVYRIKQVTRR